MRPTNSEETQGSQRVSYTDLSGRVVLRVWPPFYLIDGGWGRRIESLRHRSFYGTLAILRSPSFIVHLDFTGKENGQHQGESERSSPVKKWRRRPRQLDFLYKNKNLSRINIKTPSSLWVSIAQGGRTRLRKPLSTFCLSYFFLILFLIWTIVFVIVIFRLNIQRKILIFFLEQDTFSGNFLTFMFDDWPSFTNDSYINVFLTINLTYFLRR